MSKCEIECCDKGIVIDGKCLCDIGAFGDECFDNLQDIYKAPYYTFQGVYCAAFVFILFITIRQFQASLKTSKIPSYYTCLQYAFALIGSPQNFILVLTIVMSTCKLIWLILDPFEIYKGRTIVIERLLSEVVYTLLFYIYGCLLIVWYTMYDEISFNVYQDKEKRKFIFKYYKETLKFRLFVVFLVQISVSTMNGLRKGVQYPAFLMFCYLFLLVNFFIFIFEFLIYGRSLQKCIREQIHNCKRQYLEQQKNNVDQIEQVPQNDSICKSPESMQRYLRVSMQVSNEDKKSEIRDEIKEDVKQIEQVKPKLGVTKIKSVSFATTFIKGMRGSTFFRQESQKQLKSLQNKDKRLDPNLNHIENEFQEEQPGEEINSCCLKEDQQNDIKWENDDDRQTYQETIKLQIKAVKETKQMAEKRKQQETLTPKQKSKNANKQLNYITNSIQDQKTQQLRYQSDEHQEKYNNKSANLIVDGQILFKIQLLVYFGIILEILFGVLSITVLLTDLVRNPLGQLTYLYGSSTLQFFSLITVLKLFQDIKSQEIKNLIWIQKVGSKKNKINQHFIFSIPKDQKEDEQQQKLEQRINMITLY
ncbi:unnamed protein product (macronuclear) [Paramecium tetraurelia]|uniref:EGF-like domain-containing protein n=1 Tax=Paramecium tetraurelia TaxID=5888 RepID=A0DKD0_PARTE|nr:uncharacterized protein GSPATT00017826001 [Paramecium tetraurelia]CAK83497.1 unnamed protein product [Paramecium tetraurelia]|eukprot:XP_001450894.1 hypothetical protein (macronuclear) [Paramecium tetraurelia strain d4-2]